LKSHFQYDEFDEFFHQFKIACKDRHSLFYWSDTIFHLLLPRKKGTEKRFKGGLALWVAWFVGKHLSKNHRTGRISADNLPPWAFRMLPTPAHQDTLMAMLKDLETESCMIYAEHLEASKFSVRSLDQQILFTTSTQSELKSCFKQAIRDGIRISSATRTVCRKMNKVFPNDCLPRICEAILCERLTLQQLPLREVQHQALFLTYELIPESKAVCRHMRSLGKRVIHIMHGQTLPHYQVTLATDLILFSKIDEPWFRSRVPSDVRIWTMGHPRLEATRQTVGPWYREPRERQPRMAFFSQPVEGNYTREERIQDWRILSGLAGLAEVRFRLHPRESKEQALQDLAELGADFVQLSEEGLVEDLTWCDAVASSWSTVSMEAAACDRGVFWTCSQPEKYPQSAQLREHGLGVLVKSPIEWIQWLASWPVKSFEPPVRVTEAQLHDLGMIGDMEKSWIERLGLETGEAQERNTNHNY
jgi:hypothetical protein